MKRAKEKSSSGFLIFINLFRWLTWLLATALLLIGATPEMPALVTILIFGFIFVYNSIYTFLPNKIESVLRRLPVLILVDVTVCIFLLAIYGWRSPFYLYSFSPLLLSSYLWGVLGGLTVATLMSIGYLTSVALFGHTLAELERIEMIDTHIAQFFDYYLLAAFFSYPTLLLNRLNEAKSGLEKIGNTLEKSNRRLTTLNDVGAVIQSILKREEILKLAVEALVVRFGFATAAIGVENKDDQDITWISFPDGDAGRLISAAMNEKLKTMDKIDAPEAERQPEADKFPPVDDGDMVVIPLFRSNRRQGLIVIDNKKAGQPITDEDIKMLRVFADQISVAISNADLFEHSEELGVARERNRIAGEMHDNIVQKLFGMRLILDTCIKDADDQRLAERLKLLQQTFAESLKELRSTLDDLYEGDIGKKKLSSLINDLRNRPGADNLTIRFEIKGREPQIENSLKKDLYLAASEALTNVIKHAGAKRVTIGLAFDKVGIELKIADDGIGFEPEAMENITGGLGLKNIRQRAEKNSGKVRFENNRAGGTRVILTVPYLIRQENQTL